jgi:hypothetical protein
VSLYLGSWSDLEDVERDYQKDLKEELRGGEMLIAWYGSGSYCGGSFVFFRKSDGTYWMDECHHCSCNGVEGSWGPTQVQLAELLERAHDDGWNGEYEAAEDLRAALSDVLEELLCPDERTKEVYRILKNADVQRCCTSAVTPPERCRILDHARDILAEQYPDVSLEWVTTVSGTAYLRVSRTVH